nr:hypothetical protein [Nocardia jejuensis]
MLLDMPTQSTIPVVFVQANAHDRHGVRVSWIDLVMPSREHAELTLAQARQVADVLIAGGDSWDADKCTVRTCPPQCCPSWCEQHDEAIDPSADRWHGGPVCAVPVAGPKLSGADVQVRLCAKDIRRRRQVSVGLTVWNDTVTELTGPQARRLAAALLNVADDLCCA